MWLKAPLISRLSIDTTLLSTAIALQTTSPQPVYGRRAADDLHNLSTAITLQTTSPQPVYGHRAADDLYYNRHYHHNIPYNTELGVP
jgi:hypothetical protein